MEITLDLAVLVWVAGAIATVSAAIGIIYKAAKKLTNVDKIQHIEGCLDRDKKRLDSIDKDIREIKNDQKVILHSVFIMLQHFATNNGKEEMKAELDKMMEYMTNK